MEKQILYHGSTVVVEQPLVSIGRKDLDVGPGFYLTPLFEQASKWAVRIKTIRRAEQAVVNTYEFSPNQFYEMFLVSDVSMQFQTGNPTYVAGKTGCELVKEVLRK